MTVYPRAQAWRVTRKDGQVQCFTDHDGDITLGGEVFLASGALSRSALTLSSGPAVDGAEIAGALSHSAIAESDLLAGRYDGAKIELWQFDWEAPEAAQLQFVGHLGEITLQGGQWHGELRSLTEALSQPFGRSYQRLCGAALGAPSCGVDLEAVGFTFDVTVLEAGPQDLWIDLLSNVAPRWFERGRALKDGQVLGVIKADRIEGTRRRLTFWTPFAETLAAGTQLRLSAGCDKRLETCRGKFGNVINYQGFPHLPGDSYVLATPKGAAESLFQ